MPVTHTPSQGHHSLLLGRLAREFVHDSQPEEIKNKFKKNLPSKIKHLGYQRRNRGKGRHQKARLPTTLSQQLQRDREGAAVGLLLSLQHGLGPRLTAHQGLQGGIVAQKTGLVLYLPTTLCVACAEKQYL